MNIHSIGTLDPSTTGNLRDAIPIIDADLNDDTLFEDRPWRRPGADPTDYFNFGFDEQSWREYCTKQKTLREEQATKRRIGLVMDTGAPTAMAKGLHLGPGGNLPGMLPGMIPPLPPFLPPPPPWILQQGQHSRDRSRDREYRGESTRDAGREHRDRDRGERREHHRESTRDRDRDSHRRDSKEPARDGRSSHRDSKGGSRHSSRRSASPSDGHPGRTGGSRR